MNDDLPTIAMMGAGAKALNDCGLGSEWTLTALDAAADSVWRAMQEVRPAKPAQPAPAADALPVVGYIVHEPVDVGVGMDSEASLRWDLRDCDNNYEALVTESDHLAAIEALRQEVERLKADAALYRWIEEHALCIDQFADADNLVQVWWEVMTGRPVARGTLREAVEAAMAAKTAKLAGEL